MADYDNNMRGAGWTEKNPQSDRHPIMKGNCTIDGKEYWISVFKNKSDHAKSPDVDFKFELKDSVAKQQQKSNNNESFSDIPF